MCECVQTHEAAQFKTILFPGIDIIESLNLFLDDLSIIARFSIFKCLLAITTGQKKNILPEDPIENIIRSSKLIYKRISFEDIPHTENNRHLTRTFKLNCSEFDCRMMTKQNTEKPENFSVIHHLISPKAPWGRASGFFHGTGNGDNRCLRCFE